MTSPSVRPHFLRTAGSGLIDCCLIIHLVFFSKSNTKNEHQQFLTVYRPTSRSSQKTAFRFGWRCIVLSRLQRFAVRFLPAFIANKPNTCPLFSKYGDQHTRHLLRTAAVKDKTRNHRPCSFRLHELTQNRPHDVAPPRGKQSTTRDLLSFPKSLFPGCKSRCLIKSHLLMELQPREGAKF